MNIAVEEDSRFRGNDGIAYGRDVARKSWMPAFAGMTWEWGGPKHG